MPHDAHPMGVLVSAMSALSVFHPDANPALRVQSILNLNKLYIIRNCALVIFAWTDHIVQCNLIEQKTGRVY